MDGAPRTKYLVIHGHFYQPPRENPWTEEIERQEVVAPYHDWNEKIAYECYLPNAFSRRLDGAGRITALVNNYEWLSFNFGPTLVSYLEERFPEVYEKILEGDRASLKRLGHGNAIAQCYNHAIMPLASRRDQETQVRWGVRDFERRFGRPPEGIWLPETAVNDTTLAILVDYGFRFIVLSPHQAQRIRPLAAAGARAAGHAGAVESCAPEAAAKAAAPSASRGGSPSAAPTAAPGSWKDVSKDGIPTGFPYRCFAPGAKGKRDYRRYMDIFFYDAPLSTDVSFNHLLRSGDRFAEAIDFGYRRGGNDLVVIATDGEIYGHHEPFADMAFSYLVDSAGPRHGFTMTNFGAYLADHPPAAEVELKPGPNGEGTSWSCFHGLGRWKEDCGCTTGGAPAWNQKWRAPLRSALNALSETLAAAFEEDASRLLADPWRARDDYIDLVAERAPEAARTFIAEHASRELAAAEVSKALSLLESQRNAQLMATSCGWFFSDISGLETTQILRYAARAIELAGPSQRAALERRLIADLKGAASNIAGRGTGADIYAAAKRSSAIGMRCIAALYAVAAHLAGKEEAARLFGHPVRPIESILRRMDGGIVRLGILELASRFTLEAHTFQYLLYLEGDAGFFCYVKEGEPGPAHRAAVEHFNGLAREDSKNDLLAAAAEHFGAGFTARDFLPEDRERILRQLARRKLDVIEERFGEIYEESRKLLRLLKESNMIVPPSLLVPARIHLTKRLVERLEHWERSLDPAGLDGIRRVVSEAKAHGIPLDTSSAASSFTELILDKVKLLAGELKADAAAALEQFVNLSAEIGIETDFRDIQNRVYDILAMRIAPMLEDPGQLPPDRAEAKRAIDAFLSLARRFNFNTEAWEKKLAGS